MQVSIIIPTYQGEKYISRAIRSAIDQNFPRDNYEIIVVNDGSTDNTSEILKIFNNDIKVITFSKNKGLAAARNSGLRIAKGRFVINLDSDDYIHQDLLKVGTLFLNLNNNFDAVSFDYFVIDKHENHIIRRSGEKDPIACGIMFRKEQLIDIGLYDEAFQAREEEDLRIRFTKKYNIFNISLPFYRYRKHENNLTKNYKLMNKYQEKLNKKYE